jgi:8-oxo-dGTP pyrophosphatase MutT (NUDIX family)
MSSKILVYHSAPEGFSPKVEVSAVYVNVAGKLLFLKRSPHCVQGEKWGVPAGKLEKNELPLNAAKRELQEETGMEIDLSTFKHFGELYFRKPNLDYIYHLYSIDLDRQPDIKLSDEHTSYMWVSKDNIEIPLMDGALEALNEFNKKNN